MSASTTPFALEQSGLPAWPTLTIAIAGRSKCAAEPRDTAPTELNAPLSLLCTPAGTAKKLRVRRLRRQQQHRQSKRHRQKESSNSFDHAHSSIPGSPKKARTREFRRAAGPYPDNSSAEREQDNARRHIPECRTCSRWSNLRRRCTKTGQYSARRD